MTVAKKANGKFYGTGRRKSSIARVYLVPVTVTLQSIRDHLMSISVLKHSRLL